MDISTTFMGLSLNNPFIAGPSPLTNSLDTIKRLEDKGIGAIVLLPLFEEILQDQQMALFDIIETPAESFSEALSYFPEPDRPIVEADAYMAHLGAIKESISIPVIGNINAVAEGKWLEYAVGMEQAGADGLELDFYCVANDATESGEVIERRMIEALEAVKAGVKIPVSVKLTPFHTSFAHFAKRLDAAGADGLVLFHRFYEPDIDIENLEPISLLPLSDSHRLLLRLRWLAIVSGQVRCSLAANGGVHSVEDTVKAVMTGAHCVQLTSSLMKNGIEHVENLNGGLARWLELHEYDSLRQMRATMNIERIPDPKALSRAHYMRLVGSWETP